MDYVHIDNLRILGKHGHYARERTVEQEFEVSVKVGTDLSGAGRSDKLVDTIDYSDLKKIVIRAFAQESRYLVEALANDIATEVLKDPRALEVTITIKKTVVWPDATPGVSITRARP